MCVHHCTAFTRERLDLWCGITNKLNTPLHGLVDYLPVTTLPHLSSPTGHPLGLTCGRGGHKTINYCFGHEGVGQVLDVPPRVWYAGQE